MTNTTLEATATASSSRKNLIFNWFRYLRYYLLQLDEALSVGAVFVIVSWSDGLTDGWVETLFEPAKNFGTVRDRPYVSVGSSYKSMSGLWK